jgi:hypothetical protein
LLTHEKIKEATVCSERATQEDIANQSCDLLSEAF